MQAMPQRLWDSRRNRNPGIKFITGNYDKDMPQRKFDDDMCNQCHISMDYMADQTDYLRRNPHRNHWT